MIDVRWVGYGSQAAEALREAIAAAKGDQPLTPVTVIVPSNHVGVSARRVLGRTTVCTRGTGLVAVTFLTVHRLAELFGAPVLAAAGRRPVSTPVIAAAMRTALASAPGVFAPVAAHPATESALVATYRELRDLDGDRLEVIGRSSRRARDVVALYRLARARLEGAWYDEEDLLATATAMVTVGPVILYLPQRLSGHAARLLRSLPDLTFIAGSAGVDRADAEVAASVGRLTTTTTRAPQPDVDTPPHAPGTRIVSTSDADEEVRVAVRAIVDAARAGTPLDRVAVLHPGIDPYPRLMHEHLGAAEIPINGPAATPLSARVAGRALLGLLDLATADFRRQDVFAWLATAPVRFGGSIVPVAAWERVSRRAGVVSGRADWSERLAWLAVELDTAAGAVGPDAPQWRAQRDRDDARRARNLRRFMLELIDDVARAAERWSAHAAWAAAHLPSTNGWPAEEVDASARVERALHRLAGLDAIEGPVGLDVFGRTLLLELESDLGRTGRFGHGVFVGPISMGIGLDLDLAIVVGLAEGSLPSTIREDSLLPDRERREVDLPMAADRTERQHRWLLASLAGARSHLLSFPRGDLRRSTERVPSRWLGEGGDREDFPSFDAALRGLREPATAQEHRLRAAISGTLADPVVVAGAEMIRGRASDRFTRFDGNLADLGVAAPDLTSATRLERWVRCPFAYLLGDVLGVDEVDNPEDHLQITPLVRGELVHAVLERFVLEVLARPAGEQPEPDQPWTDADHALMLGLAAELFDDSQRRGLTGRPIFWERDRGRLARELDRFLDEDGDRRRVTRSRPFAAELGFDAVPFPLPGGGVVRFRGKADRVDVAEDGSLRVIDYKTGRSDGYTKALETKLQLPVYALAARHHHGMPDAPVHAEYWFVTQRERFKRIGFEVTPDVIAAVGARIEAILRGIERGVFANHPQSTSTAIRTQCAYCDPDGLGETDLQRRWLRKRDDPALAPYLELVDDAAL